MAGHDYVGDDGLPAAVQRWMDRVAPYGHPKRPHGDPTRSALLVLDVQGFFCDPASHAYLPAVGRVLPSIRALAGAMERAGSPVLYTRHALDTDDASGRMGDWWGDIVREGTPAAALCGELGSPAGARVLRKTRYDAFAGTDLDRRLRDAGVTTVVLAGVMTHLCVETTARTAFALGYHVVVAADATASADEELHVGALRSLAHGFARVRTADDIVTWRSAKEAGVPPRPPRASRAIAAQYDVIVAGAGPAGLAAARPAPRPRRRVGLFEAHRPGGLLRQADLVENYLGAGWTTGEALVARFTAQAERAGVHIHARKIDVVELRGPRRIRVTTADGATATGAAVIIATGSRPMDAGIDGEAELAHRLVFYGVRELIDSSDGPGEVIVVGGGDAALDQAAQLRRRGWRPTIFVRGGQLRALALLRERAEALGIEIRHDTRLVQVEPDGDEVVATWRGAENSGTLRAQRVLVAVGRVPALPRVLDRGGEVIDDPADLAHATGVFLAGDVRRGRFRQVAMAAGDGIEAAMAVAAELETDR